MSGFDDLCEILREEFGSAVAEKVVQRIRDALGSQRLYVPSKPRPDVNSRDTVKTIRKKHGVARSTAYNWINRYRL